MLKFWECHENTALLDMAGSKHGEKWCQFWDDSLRRVAVNYVDLCEFIYFLLRHIGYAVEKNIKLPDFFLNP